MENPPTIRSFEVPGDPAERDQRLRDELQRVESQRQDVEAQFDGFVSAVVTAIEQRDPATSGHSTRVSRLTVALGEIVNRTSAGPYGDTRFSADQMKEIRYAALLHDFGKAGVRDDVLGKAKKLYPAQLEAVQNRFDYLREQVEARYERRKVRALLEMPREEALAAVTALESERAERCAKLEEEFAAISHANEPTVVPAGTPSGTFERLFEIARKSYRDPRGAERALLTPDEVRFLTIPQGSLDGDEREQIESHVLRSFSFLMQIPWTREMRGVPEIAGAHHEKLNGTGYPYRLKGDEIPVQARMMTICDIFDALSASDRPYKQAMSPERALAILDDSVKRDELDADLFRLFIEGRVYDLAATPA